MRKPEQPPTGLNVQANGPLKGWLRAQMGFGPVGCAYRGTTICAWDCYFAPVKECDWHCSKCDERALCKCGQDGQEVRVARWLGLEIEEEEGEIKPQEGQTYDSE
jgi:hypothetical protein